MFLVYFALMYHIYADNFALILFYIYTYVYYIYICIYIYIYIYIYIIYIYIYIHIIHVIHHWSILWSSYRKLAWVGFEPTNTEFRSDALTALTDRVTRLWVQLALRKMYTEVYMPLNKQWNEMWNETSKDEIKWNVTLTKRWSWSSCIKLTLSASWTHGLVAQWIRASERNSVIMGSNPTQANFL